jgi:hypothetical protein
MLFNLKIIKGYGVNVAGGNTILVFEQSSTTSNIVKSIDVNTHVIADNLYAAADGRVWYHLESGEGFIIGIGNTNITYAQIVNSLPPLSQVSPQDIKINTAPSVVESTLDSTAVPDAALYDDSKTVVMNTNVINNNTGNSINITPLAPEDHVPSIYNNYTEGMLARPDTVNVEGGMISNIEIYNNFLYSNEFTNAMKTIHSNLDILTSENQATIINTLTEKFNRYKMEYPDTHLNKSFSYVFFTRPDINILENENTLIKQLANDPTFYYLFRNSKNVLLSLTNEFSGTHDLLPLLSNASQSFDVTDEFIKTMEHGETLTGYKMQYGKHNIESKTAGTFNINYEDNKELLIYKIHKAWVEYISRVYRGELVPKQRYLQNKEIDYACSVYYIVCGPDGETILFWSKYYGVFPTSIPSSTTSFTKGSMVRLPEYSINYAYSMREDYNPFILIEFNLNSKGDYIYKPTYIKALGRPGPSISGNPFIQTTTDASGRYEFKLRFR